MKWHQSEGEKMTPKRSNVLALVIFMSSALFQEWQSISSASSLLGCQGLSLSSFSQFHGKSLEPFSYHGHQYGKLQQYQSTTSSSSSNTRKSSNTITMRKQKAHDKRTRRMQRGDTEMIAQDLIRENLLRESTTITDTPMSKTGMWKQKRSMTAISTLVEKKSGGRGRSRKRSILYNSLSSYHNKFLQLLTAEFRAEEKEVIDRIEASMEDPLGLEVAGHALYDMYAERRGNLYSDEIYRLTKANDATNNVLPQNCKFAKNDIILLTLQPLGSGDIFDPKNLPTSSTAVTAEGRIVSTGPTYVDIVMPAGIFEATFGPAPNNQGASGKGKPSLRLRVDRFFSEVSYERMVEALTRISSIPDRTEQQKPSSDNFGISPKYQDTIDKGKDDNPYSNICMDELLREAIISTHAFTDPSTPLFHDGDACDLQSLERQLSKPPMQSSVKLANQVLTYVQANSSNIFKDLNGPQLAAIGAALTRKLTIIQGPPGTGKTACASVIGFGFTHQCRTISSNAKVLACAFSNVGADNLSEGFLQLGLKVVRIGKASAVSESLWAYTLDAAIDRDPDAKKALDQAATATAELMKIRKEKKFKSSNWMISERVAQEVATSAVKEAIKASNIAATRAMRDADIIVSTSTGAADPKLLAACGLNVEIEELAEQNQRARSISAKLESSLKQDAVVAAIPKRSRAPDGLPPLSLPFVIIDEACQSVEPGTLIPLTSSNSCRSIVMLGDPCQLPPTVKSDPDSSLSISLMERLAATLPAPMIKMKDDSTTLDRTFLDALPIKQSKSLLNRKQSDKSIYRKRFAGSLLLSMQYRMHPSIAAFSSAVFYDGLLSTPSFVTKQRIFPGVLNESLPSYDPSLGVRLINVGGRCNERRGEFSLSTGKNILPRASQESMSTYRNEAEASRVVSLIKQVLEFEQQYCPDAGTTIGIVTPYTGQVHLLRKQLAADEEILSMLNTLSATVEVNSVDGYQGRERDIIIFSAVRSNRRGNVGFLSDWRRLNVALTRAKSALLVVGDIETLKEGDVHWAAFCKWCEGVRCIIDDTEFSTEECESF